MRLFCVFIASIIPSISLAQEASRPRPVSVQSSALTEIGPWGAAALPEGLTPLASDLWRGADPATLAAVFAQLSSDQRFPSLQTLTRQAIFSGGTAPTDDVATTRARFEAANRLGPADAAARLIFGVPRLASDVTLATIAIDAGLRVGRVDEACNLIEAVGAQPSGSLWLESRAVCYALNVEAAAANLSVDLAKSRGLTDTWLSRAIAAVAGPVGAPPPFRADSGRALAISLRAKLKPPVTISNIMDPAALSALIGTADFMAERTPDQRQDLIRNAASRGVLPIRLMVSEIAPTTVGADVPKTEVVEVAPSTVTSETPVIPIIEPISIPTLITEKIIEAPSLALRAVEARTHLADLKTIMATQAGLMTVAQVPFMIEVALWSGEGTLASSIASLTPDPIEPRLNLVLALYDEDRQIQIIDRIIASAATTQVAQRGALRDVLVAWSAGMPATGSGLALLLQPELTSSPMGSFGIRTALDLAANRGSKGEVILLSARALQGVDPAKSDFETLIGVIRALRQVGLTGAARDVARDYLLATYVTLPSPLSTKPRAAGTAVRPTVPRPAVIPNARPITGPVIKPTTRQAPSLSPSPSPRPNLAPPQPTSRNVPRATAPPRTPPTPIERPRPKAQPMKPTWGTP